MGEEEQVSKIRPPSMLDALIPIISLVILLGTAVYLYGSDATGGPIQVALILCTMIAGLVGLKNGLSWEDMGHAAVEGISTAMGDLEEAKGREMENIRETGSVSLTMSELRRKY